MIQRAGVGSTIITWQAGATPDALVPDTAAAVLAHREIAPDVLNDDRARAVVPHDDIALNAADVDLARTVVSDVDAAADAFDANISRPVVDDLHVVLNVEHAQPTCAVVDDFDFTVDLLDINFARAVFQTHSASYTRDHNVTRTVDELERAMNVLDAQRSRAVVHLQRADVRDVRIAAAVVDLEGHAFRHFDRDVDAAIAGIVRPSRRIQDRPGGRGRDHERASFTLDVDLQLLQL